MKSFLLILSCCLLSLFSFAQDWSLERSVQMSAVVEESPAKITLSWTSQPVQGFTLYKRMKGDNNWGASIADLPSDAISYEDLDVVVGESYEYRIDKISSIGGFGAINAGIKIPTIHLRGRLILLVDDTQAASLTTEIDRLISDIEGDGWAVTRLDISPMDDVSDVKDQIVDIYEEDEDNVKAVLLLGNIPVPYSGQNFPDGHTDHEGAWPADLYYGEMNGNWTDSNVNVTITNDSRNHNIPFDGKFDQTIIPSDVDLQVARIDLSNLPAFAESETELLRKYLNKNHAFRHKEFTATPRGLIENNFGGLPEGFGQNGYRNFSTMFGPEGIDVVDFDNLKTESYLWSFAAGGGSFTSAGGITTTQSLAEDSLQVVFSMIFGSYFGDWDSENNLLRSMLASGTVLTSAWAGRPKYQFEHMALGENIGYGMPLTQNTATDFLADTCYGGRLIHIALHGDPTLRMHTMKPVGPELTFSENEGNVTVNWTASEDADLGYHIYRKENANDAFYTLLNEEPTTELTYTDSCATANVDYSYMVRALRLETSASGSYHNLSQGIKGDYNLSVGCISSIAELELYDLKISPNPADDLLGINIKTAVEKSIQLELVNTMGQVVLVTESRTNAQNTLNISHLPPGMYLLNIKEASGEQQSAKILIQ
ncbi:MAG: T9SS type A sorting domain-containing protein [Saprospiraceae bacterium]